MLTQMGVMMAGKLEKAIATKAKELAEKFHGEITDTADEIIEVLAKKNQTADKLSEIHEELITQISEQLSELKSADDEDGEEEGDDSEEENEEDEE